LKLAGWLFSGQVDILHSYLNTANFYSVIAGKLATKGKIIVSERSTGFHYSGFQRVMRNWAYKNADLVVANSAFAREEIQREVLKEKKKVLYIPNAIDTKRFSPISTSEKKDIRDQLGWLPDELVFLTVASYNEQKNHEGLIESIRRNTNVSTPYKLRYCWVGRNQPKNRFQKIQSQLNTLGSGQQIDILGEKKDVIKYYRAADVFLLNSLWEGTPNVVLEAMACGCPVIATDISDISRYVVPGQTGWLIPPKDPNALSNIINDVSKMNKEDLQAIGSQARQYLLDLDLDMKSIAVRYEKIYLDLMA
jgi:glycosyltransferase involved in cell wall biosynthesis